MQAPAKLTWVQRLFTVQHDIVIDAPPRVVWRVLVNLSSYREWNPFTYQVESTLDLGSPVRLQVRMRDNWHMDIHDVIRGFEPEKLIIWGTLHPRWLLYGNRFQVLTPLDGERTHYRTWESFSGLLALPTTSQFPLIHRGFVAVCQGLKSRAESLFAQEKSLARS